LNDERLFTVHHSDSNRVLMRLALTLGGGGARGAAHIGVWLELARLGIRPHLITGTSIGGMVGALIAAGLDTAAMMAFFQKLNVGQMFALPGHLPAISHNSKIERLLEETLGRPTFADLQIPLAIVTVDLVSHKEVILDEGDLVTAVLATTAIPVLLPPVERAGQMLVDGGLVNNVPFDIARARGATYVIAVNLTNPAPYGPADTNPLPPGLWNRALALTQRLPTWPVLSATADIIWMQSFNARMAISQPDLLLTPDVGMMSIFDFYRWQEAFEAGQTAALTAEATLRRLQASQ
jgi:NTE family protein